MKSTPLLIPRPFDILNKPIGIKVPIMLGTPRVPYEKVQRLRTISRVAPENASEAINGLGEAQTGRQYAAWMQKARRPAMTHGGYGSNYFAPAAPAVPVKGPVYNRPAYQYPYMMNRGWTAFNGLGADPAAPAPSVWESINNAISQPAVGTLAQTGVNFYVNHQTNQANAALLNTQAQTAALQAQLAQQRAAAAANAPKSGMPGWVIPVAAVGVVGLAATFFFLRK